MSPQHFDAHAHIDYLSVTIPPPMWGDIVQEGDWKSHALFALETLAGSRELPFAVNHHTASFTAGAHGFKYRLSWPDAGVFVQWGAAHGRVHIVFSGVGCALLKSVLTGDPDGKILREIFNAERVRVTRIDIAVDVMTGDMPSHVCRFISPRKGTPTSIIESTSGETIGFGGRSGERYLRIYKYAPPHPRAHLLRWEWELKGNHALQASAAVARGDGLPSIVAGLMKPLRIVYPPLLGLIGESPPTPLNYQRRETAGHTLWLYRVCIPALRDAVARGDLEPADLRKALLIE